MMGATVGTIPGWSDIHRGMGWRCTPWSSACDLLTVPFTVDEHQILQSGNLN